MNNPSKLIKFAETCSGMARKKICRYSSKFSRKDYTQWQLLTLLCVMKRYRLKYREIVEILHLMPEFLEVKKMPHWTTLNKFFLRIHCTTTRRHDSQIILPLVNRTAASLLSLHCDAGYDARRIRDSLRRQGIRPVIKHRVFWNIDKAHNARMKDYGKRSMSETVNSMVKRRYGDYVSCRT